MPAEKFAIGTAFSIDELKKTPVKNVRKPNARDVLLTRAILAASTAPESSVLPFTYPASQKTATVRAAAVRLIKEQDVAVFVGLNKAYPNTLLLSRSPLSNRGRKRS